MNKIPKVGDKVFITAVLAHLKHRKQPVRGVVTKVDGLNLIVRPSHCKWLVHLYPNEVEVIKK